ncbi:cobyric acid synthase [Gloeobacter violaceus]|uniref:Cobyric acid synthase n=1 Tax=Gloeobacter violaceus (strain ATCC 29082 / PCC 7421) TaxID=251221 RepID=COBQ_GLOVI|nr:cobyric acid synthase [Gloeobacter violaceus]Q7NJR0.1 RecName: Full=Cobyric acid synthase [Gloeobacter violaceus PCC 7421]BAC89713.1 cobyric acid synthase [Gloeobacter violaceus PCC 7421]
MAALMVVGTSSHAGKSLLVTALGRLFHRRGVKVAPFKGQNMALNAYVTAEGHEIGHAQAVQAWACGLEPSVAMNPILLKPQGNMTSQVILKGKPAGVCGAVDYYRDYFEPGWQAVVEALAELQSQYELVICEGAGSPAEVNLRHRDLTNMRVALHLGAPTLLVTDIDRGGALAHVVGTLQVLPPEERALIKGIVINKFRGSLALLQPGLDWLAQYTGVPVVGVLPWLEMALPEEDSMGLFDRRGARKQAQLEIVVIRLPRIANFTDFDALEAEPSVRVRYVSPDGYLGHPDAIILPGSKATIPDLLALEASGMAAQIRAYGGVILGICGGLQILGSTIDDPEGFEGHPGRHPGLGLIEATTVFEPLKITRQVQVESRLPAGEPVVGYEIHQGQTTFAPTLEALFAEPHLGVVSSNRRVWGTYLHGLLDNHAWRRHWLNALRERRGLPQLPVQSGHYREQREEMFERLADAWEPHLPIDGFAQLAGFASQV